MRILCVGYRDWALKIYDALDFKGHDYKIIRDKDSFSEEKLRNYEPDVVLFYGWSDIVSSSITSNYKCLMLHPSPLPFYRGGSPIQNQIINGELDSAVTIFIMDDGIDTGDIIKQEKISLDGTLEDIFSRISIVGVQLTQQILKGNYKRRKQKKSEGSYFPRRTPSMSEITVDELKTKSALHLFNKIRMLQSPYPLAYYKLEDGRKIIFRLEEDNSLN